MVKVGSFCCTTTCYINEFRVHALLVIMSSFLHTSHLPDCYKVMLSAGCSGLGSPLSKMWESLVHFFTSATLRIERTYICMREVSTYSCSFIVKSTSHVANLQGCLCNRHTCETKTQLCKNVQICSRIDPCPHIIKQTDIVFIRRRRLSYGFQPFMSILPML